MKHPERLSKHNRDAGWTKKPKIFRRWSSPWGYNDWKDNRASQQYEQSFFYLQLGQ
jgi:hypothetical protein